MSKLNFSHELKNIRKKCQGGSNYCPNTTLCVTVNINYSEIYIFHTLINTV